MDKKAQSQPKIFKTLISAILCVSAIYTRYQRNSAFWENDHHTLELENLIMRMWAATLCNIHWPTTITYYNFMDKFCVTSRSFSSSSIHCSHSKKYEFFFYSFSHVDTTKATKLCLWSVAWVANSSTSVKLCNVTGGTSANRTVWIDS